MQRKATEYEKMDKDSSFDVLFFGWVTVLLLFGAIRQDLMLQKAIVYDNFWVDQQILARR